jgi:hypothetical protein
MTTDSGDHITINTETILGQMIATAAKNQCSNAEEWQRIQQLKNRICSGGDGTNLETDSAAMIPSGKGTTVFDLINTITDALTATPDRFKLLQG